MFQRTAALLLAAVAAHAEVTDVTVTDCCKGASPACKGTITTLNNPGTCNAPGTCVCGGSGTLDETANAANMELSLELLGAKIFDKSYNACGDMTIPLPMGLGQVNVTALDKCPAASGPIKVDITIDNKLAPPGKIVAHSVTKDDQGNTLLCLDITFTPKHSATAAVTTQWDAWKLTHGKVYAAEEETTRARIFEKNMAIARTLQRDEPHAQFGASPFADLTEEEFASYHNGASFYAAANTSQLKQAETFTADVTAAAEAGSVDWRAKGAVTPVKDQKKCGSCWAFSTTGNIEGQWFLAGNKLVALSEQQLIACDKGNGDHGCMGGLPSTAYGYVQKAGGLETESDYPLTSTLPISFAKCKFDKSKAAATIASSITIASKEDQMLAWLTKNGPISIGVNAGGSTWQLYKSGIVSNCKVAQPDHGVLIVGYGQEGSKPYWIVKNSWNTKWGEDGYIRLAYGSNQCNIQITPTSAVVKA